MFISMATYALMFIGTPYVWGGNNIHVGVDCSGLVAECLRMCGELDKTDLTAQGIYDRYKHLEKKECLVRQDTLLFFGKSKSKITHIAIAVNENQLVEAGGEGRTATDDGYVRVRPINHRKDLVATINLF